jgi:leucyl aminopeptidase
MEVHGTSAPALESGADTIAIGVFDGEAIAPDPPGEPLAHLLERGEAGTDTGRIAVTHVDDTRVLVLGLGARARFDAERARAAAALAHTRARELRTRRLCWELPRGTGPAVAAALIQGTLLAAYRFTAFKRPPKRPAPDLDALVLSGADASVVARAALVTAAQNRARDLGNRPANELTPSTLADYAMALDGRDGIAVSVMDEDAIRAAGMGAFAAISQGSAQGARLIELRYDGPAPAQTPLLAFVGKAVTFDSGGLSLKSAATMHEMKFDMCGGAAVIEAIAALAALGAPVRVLGIVGATENLPSSTAIKPGDIVTALDGTTIEVNNTDAEGRLVLGDCLTHARRLGAERIVDLATLTGAIVTALGSTYAGLMANDDAWAEAVRQAGERSGELLWRLPLHERYAEMVRGRYADITNRTERREAAAITAAEFLHHFVGEVPWAHLDIAAVADNLRRPYLDKGASGFGVQLLVELALGLGVSDGLSEASA